MELRLYAEEILFGRDIETKLRRPRALVDTARGPALDRLPVLPARPAGLRFLDEGESRPREARFPARGLLARDRDRGRVMHFFANHELLALELMALTLLRFPEAEPEFRRVLAGVMIDEQKHLELYLGRMAALGCDLGDLPCGRFFWERLKDVPTPRHFLAGMSLGFEQANLDFAAHYLDLLAGHEDQDTLAVLRSVHDDEIRHVRRGLDLFRGELADEALFPAFRAHLSFPLGPQHARGRPFSRGAREAAGLPRCFIDEMEADGASRGRPPRLRLMNPAVEDERANRPPTELTRRIEDDLALLPALVAEAGDVVLLARRPSRARRLELARLGLASVEWLDLEEAPRQLAGRPLADLAAFGRSPRSAATARVFGVTEKGLDAEDLFDKRFVLPLRERLLDRLDPVDRARVAFPATRVCLDPAEAIAAAAAGGFVIKPALGAAGRGQLRLRRASASPAEAAGLAARLAGGRAFLVEDWLAREADLSWHLDRDAEGRLGARGLVRFHNDGHGQFLAAETARAETTLPRELQRFLKGEGPATGWLDRLLGALRSVLEESLRPYPGEGPLGIDMMIHRAADGGLRLQPLVEINARLSMGRIALELGRRLRRGRPGLFAILRRDRGHDEIAGALELARRRPARLRGEPALLEDGIVLLGDDLPERRFLPLLAVGEARRELLAWPGLISVGGR